MPNRGHHVAALLIVLLLPVAGCGHLDRGTASLAGPSGGTSSPPRGSQPSTAPLRNPAPTPVAVAFASSGAGRVVPTPLRSPSGRPASAPSSSAGSAAVVHLTEADSGRTLTVQVSTKIHRELHPIAGSYDPPQVDRPGVLREDAHHGGYPEHHRRRGLHRPGHRDGNNHQPDGPGLLAQDPALSPSATGVHSQHRGVLIATGAPRRSWPGPADSGGPRAGNQCCRGRTMIRRLPRIPMGSKSKSR